MAETLPNFPDDPYADRPTFAQTHAREIAAGVVFFLTVALAVVAFPPYHAPEFAYAMLVPGIFWAYLRPSLKFFVWTMFAAQAVAWTILLGWLHHVTWVGLILLGPVIGAWVGVWYLAAWWTLPRMLGRPVFTRLLAMLGLCALWAILEWSRTWVLGGFPWLPLAASQWERSSILQVASYTGAIGISFVLVAMNLGFGAYAHRLFREGESGLRKRSQEFFLAVFLLLICLSIHVQEAFNRRPYTVPLARVAFVQPYIPATLKWDPKESGPILNILQQLTLNASSTGPDLILWPEAATPWAVRGDASVQSVFETLVRRARAPLLLGSIAIEGRGTPQETWRNGAFVIDPQSGLQTAYYTKRKLVPFGEFVPLRPILGWLEKVVPIGGDFEPGDSAAPLVVRVRGNPLVVGPLICYEDIYPNLSRASALAGAEVLVVITNNGWFGEGGAAYQHAAHAVLRAVETRRPVLRDGNGGWSGWIDEFGSIHATLTNDDGSVYFRGTKTISVSRDSRWIGQNSFYVQHGDWFILVCFALVLLGYGALQLGAPAKVPEVSTAA